MSLSVLASVFAALEHFQIVKKFDYTFLSPKMQVWLKIRAEVAFFILIIMELSVASVL